MRDGRHHHSQTCNCFFNCCSKNYSAMLKEVRLVFFSVETLYGLSRAAGLTVLTKPQIFKSTWDRDTDRSYCIIVWINTNEGGRRRPRTNSCPERPVHAHNSYNTAITEREKSWRWKWKCNVQVNNKKRQVTLLSQRQVTLLSQRGRAMLRVSQYS